LNKYKKGQVGIARHPELYKGEKYIPVFEDVETELAMWKIAEKMSEIIDKSKLDWRQMMFVFHYVMNLQDMDDDEMYKHHAWQMFKISQSQAKQAALSIVGKSAKQMVAKND